ncbi:hypothetical protein [Terrisporobacter petrolearius]|uniref:hypothetical protein n=1 Tax=Terrisporobacter petrolearius TaxID=1460447 RepID=UPI003B00480B
MLSRFLKYKKFTEFVDYKSMESIIALLMTMIFVFISECINLYEKFDIFQPALQNIAIYVAAALIGMIGIILAGISIVICSINKENRKVIERLNGENTLEELLVSFEFLAFIVGIQILVYFCLYLILYSELPLLPKLPFYIIVILLVFNLTFTLFYTVQLVGNSIRIFIISKKYDDVIEENIDILHVANEVRIDFILKVLSENLKNDSEDLIKALESYTKECSIEEKELIIKYFEEYYS